jgi:hypothetical protein
MDSKKSEDAVYDYCTSIREGVFEIVVTGELTKGNIVGLMKELRDLVISKNPQKVLVDVRNMKSKFEYAEMYFIAVNIPSCFDKIPTAIVHHPKDSLAGSFHEDMMRKNGLTVKWLTGIDDARKWLKKFRQKHQSFRLSK